MGGVMRKRVNTAFIDGLVDALDARGLNALPVFTSSLRALDGDLPAALRLTDGHAHLIISTLSFALGEVNAGAITSPDIHDTRARTSLSLNARCGMGSDSTRRRLIRSFGT